MTTFNDASKQTTTGHELSNADQLDGHYAAASDDYAQMLDSVGLKAGWHVLDAACGSGTFLPLMAEKVGSMGRLSAVDIAPENVELVAQRANALPCPVDAKVGELVQLDFPDAHFDAVWCANACQFLTDEELERCLAEFVRVTKPGGIIAIKEYDVTTAQIYPLDPFLMWRLIEAMHARGHVRMHGMLRTLALPKWLRQAKLIKVHGRSTLSEWTAPLKPDARAYLEEFFQYLANLAEEYVDNPADRAIWRALDNPASPDNPLNDPDFYFRESHLVLIGHKISAKL